MGKPTGFKDKEKDYYHTHEELSEGEFSSTGDKSLKGGTEEKDHLLQT